MLNLISKQKIIWSHLDKCSEVSESTIRWLRRLGSLILKTVLADVKDIEDATSLEKQMIFCCTNFVFHLWMIISQKVTMASCYCRDRLIESWMTEGLMWCHVILLQVSDHWYLISCCYLEPTQVARQALTCPRHLPAQLKTMLLPMKQIIQGQTPAHGAVWPMLWVYNPLAVLEEVLEQQMVAPLRVLLLSTVLQEKWQKIWYRLQNLILMLGDMHRFI